MMKVGLTGNYGMGKSSVTAMFRKLGAVTIDSDEIVAELLNQESVKARIMGLIGVEAINPEGRLDTRYIRKEYSRTKPCERDLRHCFIPLCFMR